MSVGHALSDTRNFHTYYMLLSLPMQMSTISSYRERLRAMLFKIHFQDNIAEIKPVSEAEWDAWDVRTNQGSQHFFCQQ